MSFLNAGVRAKHQRPHWGPRQVRTLHGIHAGRIYRKMYTHPTRYSRKIIVLSGPFQNAKGNWKYKYAFWPLVQEKYNFLLEGSCADQGIVPYDSGLWNPINSLHRTWHLPLSKKRLAKVRSRLTENT